MIWDALQVIGIAFIVLVSPAIIALSGSGGRTYSPETIKRREEYRRRWIAQRDARFAATRAAWEAQRQAEFDRIFKQKSRQG